MEPRSPEKLDLVPMHVEHLHEPASGVKPQVSNSLPTLSERPKAPSQDTILANPRLPA